MSQHPAIVKDRVAVITGGASGIGLAAAGRLGAAGMRIVIGDLSQPRLDEAERALAGAGVEVKGVLVDVGDRDAVGGLKEEADHFGEVSLLMNNAGRQGGRRPRRPRGLGTDDRDQSHGRRLGRAGLLAGHAGRRLAVRGDQHRLQARRHPAAG